MWVCEAGAFTVLKALAFQGRGENKDAYELVYLLQNYGSGIDAVFQRLQPLLASSSAQQALTVLENDFSRMDDVGTMRVAEFLGDPRDETIRADAAGVVPSLLQLCEKAMAGPVAVAAENGTADPIDQSGPQHIFVVDRRTGSIERVTLSITGAA